MKIQSNYLYLVPILFVSMACCRIQDKLLEDKKEKLLAMFQKHILDNCPTCRFLGFSLSESELLLLDLEKVEQALIWEGNQYKKYYERINSDSAKLRKQRLDEYLSQLRNAKSKEEIDSIVVKFPDVFE